MAADGVALATIISQYVSAIMVLIIMKSQTGASKFSVRRMAIDVPILKSMIRFGLPTGISSSLFALSNLIITSAFNTFSTTTVHARTVVQSIDSVVPTPITSYGGSTLAITAQNYSARNKNESRRYFFTQLFRLC